jgi:spore coat protein U-like protein
MKKLVATIAALGFMAMAGSGLAAGAVSESVSVSGNVSGKCKAGTPGVMSFTIDPDLPGPISAAVTTDATVFCTKSLPFTVMASSLNKTGAAASCSGLGITGTLKDGANVMDYTFMCGNGSGAGNGFSSTKSVALGITGSIVAASYADAVASSAYADTVTLTISY